MISFAEAQENARKHGHVDENGNVWLDTDIFTEIDTRIAFEKNGEILAAFIAESERLANARLEKAAEDAAVGHARNGDLLKQALNDEIEASGLDEADRNEANEFGSRKIGDALKGSFEITVYGETVRTEVAKLFGELSPEYLTLPQDSTIKNYVAKISVTDNEYQVQIEEMRRSFFLDVKAGISDFVHNFAQNKDSAKETLGKRIAGGLDKFGTGVKEMGDKFMEKAAQIKSDAIKEAKSLAHDAVHKDAVFLPAVVEAFSACRDYLKENIAAEKENTAKKKAFMEGYMASHGCEKSEAEIAWMKEGLKKELDKEWDQAKSKIEAFKQNPLMKFPMEVINTAKEANRALEGLDKDVSAIARQARNDMTASVKKNFNKLTDGAVAMWSKPASLIKGAKENVSMKIASAKMAAAIKKEIDEINKAYDRDIAAIKFEALKETVKDAIAKKVDNVKEAAVSVKKGGEAIIKLNKEVAELDKVAESLEKLGLTEEAAKYRRQIEERTKDIELLKKDAGLQLADAVKPASPRQTYEKTLAAKVEERKAIRDDDIEKAVEKLNARKEFREKKLQLEADREKRVVSIIKNADPNTKNLIEAMDKSGAIEKLDNAYRTQSEVMRADGDLQGAYRKMSEAEQVRQGWHKLETAVKNGLVRLEKTFTKDDAKELVAAASEVEKATEQVHLDFVDSNRTEIGADMQALDNSVEKLKNLSQMKELQAQMVEMEAKKGDLTSEIYKRENSRLAAIADELDRTKATLTQIAESPEIANAASFVERCNDQTTGVYALDTTKGESGVLVVKEGEDIRKQLMDFARGMGYSDEALNKVAQMANSLSDEKSEQYVEIKAVTNLMKADAAPVLCVSRTDPHMEQVNIIVDPEGKLTGAVKRNLNELNPVFGSDTIFGHDREGNAFYDMSSANNGAGKAAIEMSGVKGEIDAFEKEMDAQKEAGREAGDGRTNTELTADSLSRAFS